MSSVPQTLSIFSIKLELFEKSWCFVCHKQILSLFRLTDHSIHINENQHREITSPLPAKVQYHSQPLTEKVGPTKEPTKTGKDATDHTHESSGALRKPNDGIFQGTNKMNGHLRKVGSVNTMFTC